MKIIVFVLTMVLLSIAGCEMMDYESPAYTSLKEAAQPYVDELGPPEEIKTFDSGSYHTADYWWWSKGICHGFIDSSYDNYNGWQWDSVYTFGPIE
jgi:hypothetical protein